MLFFFCLKSLKIYDLLILMVSLAQMPEPGL
jgi:hypothetical protein